MSTRVVRLAQRAGFSAVVLLSVTAITFAILALSPSDPARLLAGPQATEAAVAQLRVRLGLDQPLWAQYGAYLARVLSGDFGVSVQTGRPVLEEIAARAPATIELMTSALIVAAAIAIPLGVWAARRRGGWPDHVVRAVSVASISMPGFWLGMLLVLLFYRELGWLPANGRFGGVEPGGPTGILLIDTLAAGDAAGFIDALAHLALPVAALAIADIGALARLVRAQTLSVLSADYMRMARASGLSEGEAVRHHAMRNVLTPLVPILALSLAQMLYGSVVIETTFGWPGVGAYVVQAIFALDYPVILGFALIASIAYVAFNLAADIAQSVLDPRIQEAV
ncbi:MAG: ABC transporter permease [Hyphomonadaceae bacterium]|nr:ABC transporter permease [Hyphomonadaceae bacterium]